jgi:hypothetical protein
MDPVKGPEIEKEKTYKLWSCLSSHNPVPAYFASYYPNYHTLGVAKLGHLLRCALCAALFIIISNQSNLLQRPGWLLPSIVLHDEAVPT